jgi:hypothetical protein
MIYGLPALAGADEDQAWIAAYVYKPLSISDRFYPFINIRERNYRNYQPDSALRTIIADNDFSQMFKLIREIGATPDRDRIADPGAMSGVIEKVIAKTSDRKLLEQYISELKIMLLLKTEIAERNTYLQTYLGIDSYNTFMARFYHLKAIHFETITPLYPHQPVTSGSKSQTIRLTEQELAGAYTQRIIPFPAELPGSLRNTELINAMIPIYPYVITRYRNSPLASFAEEPMAAELKRETLLRFGARAKIVWQTKVELYEFRVDVNYLKYVSWFFNMFNDSQLALIQAEYKKRYGQIYDVNGFERDNLTSVLSTKIGL